MALLTSDAVTITADSILSADGFIGWPIQLPAPIVPGYEIESADSTLRTDMEVGAKRTRLLTLANDDGIDVAWKFTDAQMAIFRDWWDTTAARGAAWFDVTLPMGRGGLQQVEAKFIGRFKGKLYPGMCWTVTGKLEVRG